MLDIASGLEYLHKRKPSIIHRDCKSSNILITRTGRAKIADFGLAKVKQSTRSMVRSLVGTVNWQAPELWHAHPKYDYKVDVFSCAMVFWEILQWHLPNKKFPWEGMNEHAIYDAVGSKRQRCVLLFIEVALVMTMVIQTFDIWIEKAVVSGNCRSNREDVGSRSTRQADNV
jgi:serine/threonine protein kinase